MDIYAREQHSRNKKIGPAKNNPAKIENPRRHFGNNRRENKSPSRKIENPAWDFSENTRPPNKSPEHLIPDRRNSAAVEIIGTHFLVVGHDGNILGRFCTLMCAARALPMRGTL